MARGVPKNERPDRGFGVLCFRAREAKVVSGWEKVWAGAVEDELRFWSPDVGPMVEERIRGVTLGEAMAAGGQGTLSRNLLALALRHTLWKAVQSRAGLPGDHSRASVNAWRNTPEKTRWQAGMLADWSMNVAGREKARDLVVSEIKKLDPGVKNIIVAHGLACLAVYDGLVRMQDSGLLDLCKNCYLVTVSSPLANPLVRTVFGGRIVMLPVAWWFNLANPADDSLSAPLQMVSQHISTEKGASSSGGARRASSAKATEQARGKFRELLTPFSRDSTYDPQVEEYLKHQNARFGLWRIVSGASPMPYDEGGCDTWWSMPEPASKKKTESLVGRAANHAPSGSDSHKALIIGIDDYPTASNRLSGCVNDAYLVSRFLQRSGFPEDGIRVLINERANAGGIRDRLEWLLRDAPSGATRILYYSGHGSQIGSYGIGETVDSVDECLVPWDFDWTLEKAITDDFLFDLYSQLPYDVKFVAFFDCCHAGGISRDGARRRGLIPPEDIMHRELRWDKSAKLWKKRATVTPKQEEKLKKLEKQGKRGPRGPLMPLRRIGDANGMRGQLEELGTTYFKKNYGHKGPFKPIIFKACAEEEPAEEITEGTVTYGVFTFALARVLKILPEGGRDNTPASYLPRDLSKLIRDEIKKLGFRQNASYECPSVLESVPLPFKFEGKK